MTTAPSNKIHILKTYKNLWYDVYTGLKDFEVRLNDRNFEVGDILILQLFSHDQYNNDKCEMGILYEKYISKTIKYILKGGQFGINENYVILGFK